MRIAGDAAFVAERFQDSLTKRDPAILDRVVLVDMKVALRGEVDVDPRMPRELL